jgi:hypothetical protein
MFATNPKPLEDHDQRFFFQLNTCFHSPYVTSTLTRGWVCRLQLLVALVSIVILRSVSCGTHDHLLLSQIWDSPNLDCQVTVSPGREWPGYTPSHWVPFSSPSTTRRATVGIFKNSARTSQGTLLLHCSSPVNLVVKTTEKYHQNEDKIGTTVSLLIISCAEKYATCCDIF